MRKITLLCCAILCTVFSKAQVSNYSFAASAGTYTAISGGTVLASGAWDDTGAGIAIPLGFTFTFNGTATTTCNINLNGYVSFGTTTSTTNYTPISSLTAGETGIISGFGRDLQGTAVTGEVRYLSSGGVFTIQWTAAKRYNSGTATTETFDFQIQLYQTTNVVKIVYGNFANASATGAPSAVLPQVGLRGTAITDFRNIEVLSSGNWATPTSVGTTNTSTGYYNEATVATKPALGQTYTFTPPPPCVAPAGQPTGLGLTAISTSQVNGNFTATTADGYLVVRYPTGSATTNPVTGTAYTAGTTLGLGKVVSASALTTFSATGLAPSTAYDFYVYSYNNTACLGAPAYNLVAPLLGTQTTLACSGIAAGTYAVGPTGTYASLTAVAAALQSGTTGPVIFELQSTYNSAVETFPITFSASACPITGVTIRPDASVASTLTISGSNTTAIIDINGGTNIIFDGRPGGTGTNRFLSITNTSTATGGTAIRFINDASGNTIKYCSLKSTFPSTTSGVVVFSTTTGVNGNDNNTIDNCNIDGNAGAAVSPTLVATNGIFSSGTTTTTATSNSGNTVSNCNIFDFFVATQTSSGITILSGNDNWTITNNRIYQTAARTFTGTVLRYAGITLNASTGSFTVTGNIIGFASATGTGITSISGSTNTVRGIDGTSVISTTPTSIQGNTISGIAQSTASTGTGTASPFIAIGAITGRFNIGNVAGNTIGSLDGSSAITVAASAGTGLVAGIYDFSVNSNTISNNNFGAITISGAGTEGFRAIFANTVTTAVETITNNTVGGTTAGGAITNTQVGNYSMYAINSSAPAVIMTGNIVRNMTGNANGAVVTMTGITVTATSATSASTISQNTIHSLSNIVTGGSSGAVYCMDLTLPSFSNIVERNLIHSVSVTSIITSYQLWGIVMRGQGIATFRNNMVRLGLNAAGASITTGFSIIGIRDILGATSNYYHNSVYIGGTGVASVSNTYCFQSDVVNNTRNFQNNIFWNARSNGTGTIANVAIYVGGTAANPAGLTCNYNDLYATGVNGVTGVFNSTIVTTLANWRTATNQDANSFAADPQFIAPNGDAATGDLHIHATNPTPIEQAGIPIAAVTDDFDGQSRAAFTPTDIGADAGNFVLSDISAPAITYTPLIYTCNTGDRVLSGVTILDATGVPVSGTLVPRIYYRKNAGAYFSQLGTLTSGTATNGQWNFTIVASDMGGLVVTDVVSYYIIAQDIVAIPNIGSNPGGVIATDVNTVTTHPTTPNTYAISTALSGNYTVGAGQTYPTLTAAIAAYNTACIAGPVVFSLTDAAYGASETFPITINANPYSSATNTLTIKPTLAATTISGSSASGLIVLNGADWVTINGSVSVTNNTVCPSSTASRDLTITNTNTGTTSAVIWLQNTAVLDGATNNNVRNINLVGSGNAQTFVGVGSGSTTISTASLGTGNNNNSFVNNNISKTQYGIFSQGSNLTTKNNGTVINQNLINTVAPNNVARGGILVGFENNISISGNNISEISLASSPDVFGIAVGGIAITTTGFTGNEVTNAVVTKNIIGSVRNTGNSFSACGIFIATALSGTNLVANNTISGVSGNPTPGDLSVGLLLGGGNGITQVYNNTITMTNVNPLTLSTSPSYALAIGGANPVVDIRNNILVNTQNNGTGNNYAIGYGYTPFTNLTSDHNDYSVAAGATFFIGATGSLSAPTNQLTLANLQAATGKDGAAQNVVPVFVSATDLHLGNAVGINWCLNATGAAIAAVTDDIDCQARVNPSDIGADEFNVTGDAAATPASQTVCSGTAIAAITYTGTGTTFTWTRNNTATVTGVAASGTGNITGTLTNTTATAVTVTFTVTPYGATGCTGAPFTATVLVNPSPVAIATPASQAACSGNAITPIVLSSLTTGTTYTWTRDNTVSVTGIAANGAGDISGTLTNTTAAPITVTFTITPTANGCVGTPSTATVLVNVGATITPIVTEPATCVSTDGAITLVLSGVAGPYTFAWTGTGVNPTAQNQTGLIAGVYNVTVTAGNGCQSSAVIVLNGPGGCSICPIIGGVTTNPTPTGCIGSPITLTASGLTSMGVTYGIIFKSFTAVPADPYTGGTVLATVLNGALTTGGTIATGTGTFAAANNYFVYAILTPTPLDPLCRPSASTNFVVNPTPDATATPASQTVCSGTAITTITFSGSVAGTVYNWTRNNTVAVTGIAANGAGNIAGTLTNTTAAPVTVTFTITTPIAGGCPGTPITATVLVNPIPTVTATPASQTTCSGAAITTIVNSGSAVAGTVYNWTRDNTATVTGIAANGTGNISGALTNNTAAAITVTFTITPTANGCSGTPVTATVLVNPATTAVATPASQTICSGSNIVPIVLTGVVGSTFTWTRNNTATVPGGIPASGSGSTISGFMINTTNAPVTVTFTIIPAANGCPGTPTTATVIVNPYASATATPATQTACSGSAITTIALTSNATGVTYAWTRDNTATATGIAATGTGNIAGTLTLVGTAPVTVTFTITPSFGGCAGPAITASVTINPTPAVNQPANQTLCNGSTAAATTFAGSLAGATYTWTNSTPSIGLAASGTGNIAAFTATNATTAPVTATITVTPSLNGCTGTPKTFTITVNPTATVNAIANQTLCTGATTTAITFVGTVTGTTFSWTNNTPSIGLAASGTGNIASFTATNTTSTAVTATITVTPTAAGCAGTPKTFTITVNGQSVAPTGATASAVALCGTGTVDLTVQGGALGTGASWKWYSGSCGGTLIGTGATITGVPVNGTATFYVRAEGTCNTTTCASVTVTVNPNPTITLSASPYTSLMFPLTTGITANITPSASGNTIVWYKNGAVVSGATTNVLSGITVDQLGTYTARVTTSFGCTALSAPLVIKDSASDKLFILPNPNNGQFKIRYYSNAQTFGFLRRVIIYDSKGAQAYNNAIPITAPYSIMNIDIRKSGHGLYLVVVTDSDGKKLVTGKVEVMQ